MGAGKELIAPELSREGYQVTVADTSEAGFLELNSEESFDAVLFSHSLPQMASLEAVLNKAKKLLNDKGKILIDDRAVEMMDSRTASWFYHLIDFYSILANTHSEGILPPGQGPLDRWKREYQCQISRHSQAEILRVMERSFGKIYSTTVPYLYRYFVDGSADLPRSSEAVDKVFDWEKNLIQDGLIQPIGFRIVSKKYFSYLS